MRMRCSVLITKRFTTTLFWETISNINQQPGRQWGFRLRNWHPARDITFRHDTSIRETRTRNSLGNVFVVRDFAPFKTGFWGFLAKCLGKRIAVSHDICFRTLKLTTPTYGDLNHLVAAVNPLLCELAQAIFINSFFGESKFERFAE